MDTRWTGKEAELIARLREMSALGHGVLTADELLQLGVSRGMIRTRVNAGRLLPVLARVFALPGTKLTSTGRYRAAVCSAGPNVCLSHRSALAHHGLVRDAGAVQLLGAAGAFRIAGARKWSSEEFNFLVECHQTRHLPPEHLAVLEGVRVTTVERSLRDFASVATAIELSKALSQGEKEGCLCWTTLRKLVAKSNGHRGRSKLQKAIDEWDPAFADAASDPEADFLLMIQRQAIPMPDVNVTVGAYVPDFLWPHLRVAVELDPWGTHKGLRSHRQDHRKGIELEVSGLRVIRFTAEDLYQHEERTARELKSILESQSRLLGVPLAVTLGDPKSNTQPTR